MIHPYLCNTSILGNISIRGNLIPRIRGNITN